MADEQSIRARQQERERAREADLASEVDDLTHYMRGTSRGSVAEADLIEALALLEAERKRADSLVREVQAMTELILAREHIYCGACQALADQRGEALQEVVAAAYKATNTVPGAIGAICGIWPKCLPSTPRR